MPYDVSAIAVVFGFLATTFGFLQTMLHLSCIVFGHWFVCVHICFAAKCLPLFFFVIMCAWGLTGYDGKGNGLTRLAGHMPLVGTHEAICNMRGQHPAGGSQSTWPAAIACACQFWFVFCFALCSCTKQTGVMSPVTSFAWGAGWCGCVCLGPTLDFQPSMTAMANAPSWAHTEALAGQFTSLRLLKPALLSTASFGKPAFHAQLWHTQLLHTQHFYTELSHTQLVHIHTQLLHNFLTHNSCTHNCFTLIHHTVLTHKHTQLFHIQLFLNLSILHHLCFSFLPRPASTFVSNYWKKLTCGVIRSFNVSFEVQKFHEISPQRTWCVENCAAATAPRRITRVETFAYTFAKSILSWKFRSNHLQMILQTCWDVFLLVLHRLLCRPSSWMRKLPPCRNWMRQSIS